MSQTCLKCGAVYAMPQMTCTELVPTEVVREGEIFMLNLPCTGQQWSLMPGVTETAQPTVAIVDVMSPIVEPEGKPAASNDSKPSADKRNDGRK